MSEKQLPTEMLILAGGFGTRLRSVVSDVPKPMAPVAGRPFLTYLIDHWMGQGIRRFVLSTGHLASVVESHFGHVYGSAEIAYVREQTPLGTGGALRLALDATVWSNRAAVVANGDTWFPVSLQRLCVDAERQRTPITLALKMIAENDRYAGISLSADGKVNSFGVKSTGVCHINGGCYLFDVGAIRKELSGMPACFSLENDFLVSFAAKGFVGASIQEQPFLDIGVPEDYQKAASFLK
jgi:D-glycero-alpha-D-manno-heptose 1-phosphate guanylyltransferase